MFDDLFRICTLERSVGKEEYFLGSVSEPQGVIKEEVVQFVWADKVFCFLLDVSLLVSGDEFRADRSINNVKKCFPRCLVDVRICYPFDKMLDKRFRNTCVYPVH